MFRFVKSKRSLSREGSHQSLDKSSGGDSDSHSGSHPRGTTPTSKHASTPTGGAKIVVAAQDHSKLGTTVRQILAEPAIAKRFKEYAATLHADEGLKFLDVLQASYDFPDHVAAADRIMHQFFLDQAIDEVNLHTSVRSDLLERFSSGQYESVAELFNDATYEVFTDIKKSDTFRNFLQMDEEAKRISSDETLLLDNWLVSDTFRVAIQAVQDDQTLCNLVRFCTSVSEYEKEEDRVARKARGNKISATFVQPGSAFYVSLPQYYSDAILAGAYQILPDARIECLQILAKNQSLMETVRKSLTQLQSERPYSVSIRDSAASHVQELQTCFTAGQGKKLIQKLADAKFGETSATDRALMNKVRFCTAVASFVTTPGTCDSNPEKLGAARKIVSNFVQIGSLYQVDLATGFVDDLCNSKHPDYSVLFSVIYQQFVSDIAGNDIVELAIHEMTESK